MKLVNIHVIVAGHHRGILYVDDETASDPRPNSSGEISMSDLHEQSRKELIMANSRAAANTHQVCPLKCLTWFISFDLLNSFCSTDLGEPQGFKRNLTPYQGMPYSIAPRSNSLVSVLDT